MCTPMCMSMCVQVCGVCVQACMCVYTGLCVYMGIHVRMCVCTCTPTLPSSADVNSQHISTLCRGLGGN